MNSANVLSLLKANKNNKGIQKWNNQNTQKGKLKSFGIGLTVLRKLAKQIGRNHDLALKLWKNEYYDARIISILIDDPKQITPEQAEAQIEHLDQGYLAHVFSTCGAPLSKTPFVVELAVIWMKSNDKIRRSCGYGLLYEISKFKKKTTPGDEFFLDWIEHIGITFQNEYPSVQGSMGGALMGMGKRNAKLNASALKIARSIGPIHFDSEGGKCEPFDVVKHLTSDYLKKKLSL